MSHPATAPAEAQDWRPLLDRELDALPEKYRSAIILCDLEGRTRRQAARQLGVCEGTLSSRLAAGRRLLAGRLTRRGLTLSGGALAAALAEGASAAVPAPWVVATARAAALVAAGRAAAAATPAAVLMREVLKTMLLTKLKFTVAAMAVAVVLGGGGLAYRAAGQPAPADRRAEVRPLTELEVLRREVDLLKINLELVLDKVRAQEVEIRALKDRAGGQRPASGSVSPSLTPFGWAAPKSGAPDRPREHTSAPPQPAGNAGKSDRPAGNRTADVVDELEAALKALREARDTEGQRRAADALEKALRKLREHSTSGRPTD
jgi:hypothetical protein